MELERLQDGSSGTWNVMLRPAFWFGMAMCDDQAAPNSTVACPGCNNSNNTLDSNPCPAPKG